ncbi:FAD-dependent oxidoreductase [Anderseniella sp. Alg231-50]|uniref:FAD-dependent oxidoreductase n=1 Tax=Anderseniella sp. Alg231-50 TaxID=1922226 RepID=UPI000D555A96
MTDITCDICVIGAGSGGLSVAAAASQFGEKAVLIEKGEMGGDCLNYGCVPSKALLAAGKHAHAFSSGVEFGVAAQVPKVDFAKTMAHVKDVIAGIAPHDSQERFEGLGVTVIRDAAKFVDAETVEAGGKRIKARRIVVATGSSPSAPPIPGLDSVDYFTNETIFDNTTLPAHLIIIGGGPIGMEMAQAHRRLGAKVTVLEAFQPLGKDDPELTAIVLDHLRDEGIDIRAGAKITGIAKAAKSKAIEITLEGDDGKSEKLSGSHLLVAAGRVANVDGLNLEAAGIEYDRRGIKVDKGLRSTNRKVYAIGDVAGGLQFTHVAGYQAGLVIKSVLFRLPVTNETKIIPWVTYTDPELAHIGLTEAQAKESHPGHKILRWHFAENDRARAERKTTGLIKAVVSAKGEILGCSIVAPNAGDLIQPWAMAISSGLKIKAMIDMVAAYPTLSEVSKRAATSYYADLPSKPMVRRIIGWLKIFG